MKNLKTFCIALVLFLLACSQGFSSSYYITEEQLTELERNSQEQKKQIENLNLQLMTQEILLTDLQKQLEKSEILSQNLERQLRETKLSLRQSEIKNFETYLTIGVCSFAVGVGAGIIIDLFVVKKK